MSFASVDVAFAGDVLAVGGARANAVLFPVRSLVIVSCVVACVGSACASATFYVGIPTYLSTKTRLPI